jgi:hypothetical protein
LADPRERIRDKLSRYMPQRDKARRSLFPRTFALPCETEDSVTKSHCWKNDAKM